ALIEACSIPDFPAEIALVLSNRPDAGGLDRAKAAGLPTAVVDHTGYETREAFEAVMSDLIEASGADIVCLAGFMRLLTADFVNDWRDRLINIHPSLLPSFPGLHTHERALEAGVKLHGCTVHFVRAEMDNGPIIGQAAVPVLSGDTPELLAQRVLVAEHQLYPAFVKLIASGKARVSRDIVRTESKVDGLLINPA
ncbi:MAG TPA: phosphoribosylglycinamide formyltransferase, partial [Alphaproteobacteria bacterium]|nr:phosphoribosylglycinamide formyltransferase [Alphaproteobacteria bacterium]